MPSHHTAEGRSKVNRETPAVIAALPDTRKAVLVAMLQGAAWKFGSALASAISELFNRLH